MARLEQPNNQLDELTDRFGLLQFTIQSRWRHQLAYDREQHHGQQLYLDLGAEPTGHASKGKGSGCAEHLQMGWLECELYDYASQSDFNVSERWRDLVFRTKHQYYLE